MLEQGTNIPNLLEGWSVNTGTALVDLCEQRPCLLVFLRHFGCPNCREALSDLRKRLDVLEAKGIQPVIIHQGREEQARKIISHYQLEDLPRISDPERKLYEDFGIQRGSVAQVLGLRALGGYLMAALSGRGRPGVPVGDPYQLAGMFLVHKGRLERSFLQTNAGQRMPSGMLDGGGMN